MADQSLEVGLSYNFQVGFCIYQNVLILPIYV